MQLPLITKCISCEHPYRLDIPPMYPIIAMRCYPALRAYFYNNR